MIFCFWCAQTVLSWARRLAGDQREMLKVISVYLMFSSWHIIKNYKITRRFLERMRAAYLRNVTSIKSSSREGPDIPPQYERVSWTPLQDRFQNLCGSFAASQKSEKTIEFQWVLCHFKSTWRKKQRHLLCEHASLVWITDLWTHATWLLYKDGHFWVQEQFLDQPSWSFSKRTISRGSTQRKQVHYLLGTRHLEKVTWAFDQMTVKITLPTLVFSAARPQESLKMKWPFDPELTITTTAWIKAFQQVFFPLLFKG